MLKRNIIQKISKCELQYTLKNKQDLPLEIIKQYHNEFNFIFQD